MSTAQGEDNGAPPLSTYGLPKSGVIPVYDPKENGLKAATPEQAKNLAGLGYKIGPEAELEEQKNSTSSQVGAFLTSAGNVGSFGLLNLGLAASGRRQDLQNEHDAQEANPWSSGLGAATGIGASLYGGGLAAGASRLGLKGLAGTLASQATTGAGAAALQGISDQVTEDSIMKHPVTWQRLAASAFTDVLWNAGFNVLTHGIIKSPKALRSAFGNLADKADELGWIKREMVKVPDVPGTGPQMAGFTTKVEGGFKQGSERTTTGKVAVDAAESARTQTDDFARATEKSASSNAVDETAKTASSSKSTKTGPGPTIAEQVGASNVAEGSPDLSHVKDVDTGFNWDGHSAEEKKSVLRKAIEWHVAKDPVHKEMWNKIPALEIDYKAALAKGNDKAALEILRQKEGYKDILKKEYPRFHDGENLVPGFEDLNDEYARASGNRFKDLKNPGFGAKVPGVKGSAAKPIASKLSETEASSEASSLREKSSFSDQTSSDNSSRIKTDNSESSKVHADASFKNVDKNESHGKTTTSIRWKFNKPPAQYVAGDYKIPFKGIPEKLALGAVVSPIGKTVLGSVAAGMKTAQAAVHLLNHREAIGAAFEKFGTALAKGSTPVLSVGGRAYRDQDKKNYVPVSYDTSHYQNAVDTVGAAATSPEIIHATITQKYPALAEMHPDVVSQMTATILKGVNALNDQAAKKPFDPTLQPQSFKPPRAQQVKFMRTWRLMANPMEALSQADSATIKTLGDVYPEWMAHAREHLTSEMQKAKKPLVGRPARQVSTFVQGNARAMDDSKALKRLQETAGPPPQSKQGGGLGTGSKSAKISNQAVQRDATGFQQQQMGI